MDLMKTGGRLVYATCSILEQENERQLDFFAQHFGLQLVAPPFRSLPSPGGMDGYFGAVLARR